MVDALPDGGMALLENLRFHAGEEKGDPAFADQLASLGDLYVNDAFSVSHRAHASVTGLAERLPAYAGRLMQAELEALELALGGAQRPTAAVIGGAKVSSKLDVLGHVLDRVDVLIIGGGMANTFLNAQGINVGKSLVRARSGRDRARDRWPRPTAKNVTIVLPDDVVVATEFKAGAADPHLPVDAVRSRRHDPRCRAGDGGRRSASGWPAARPCSGTGPMGAFEIEPFDQGTNAVAQAAARLTQAGKLHDGRRRRRHRGGPGPCRRARAVLLRLDRGRRLPGMARGQGAAGRRGAGTA